jgi:hypothetical protein
VVSVDLPNFDDRLDILAGIFGDKLSPDQCKVVALGSSGWTCADFISFKRYLYFKTNGGAELSRTDLEQHVAAFPTLR